MSTSARTLKRVLDSVDRACALPAKPGWERKAAAQAELFRLLADVAGGPVTSGAPGGQARLIQDLMCAVGPGANGMISSSRRRLIDQLRTGDADGAALEMENHLRTLHYMWLLAQPSGLTAHQSTTIVRQISLFRMSTDGVFRIIRIVTTRPLRRLCVFNVRTTK